mgnify:CR=1 FL=1
MLISLISTFFVLEVFNSKLSFVDSLRRERSQSGAARIRTSVASIAVEAEHACTRTIAIVVAATEPGRFEIREARVIRVPPTVR